MIINLFHRAIYNNSKILSHYSLVSRALYREHRRNECENSEAFVKLTSNACLVFTIVSLHQSIFVIKSND
jgi:hypothetical protein